MMMKNFIAKASSFRTTGMRAFSYSRPANSFLPTMNVFGNRHTTQNSFMKTELSSFSTNN